MDKHSDLPWYSEDCPSSEIKDFEIIKSGKKYIASSWGGPQPENAAFIVKAVNNHYKLLNACKLALGAFENNWNIDWNELERAIKEAEK